MAQTKRKRRSKHRGTAAGTIEARGRTGRKPTGTERKKTAAKETASDRRQARLDRPPTWRSAASRALVATVVFFVAVVVLFKPKGGITSAVALAAFMLLIYIPMGYYTDLFLYRRRQKQKQKKA
jgi:Flp pilus assembly protein TadB